MSNENSESPKLPPQNKKVFINNVDSYQGKNLAQYLSQCVVGASLEEVGEEAEAEAEAGEFKEQVHNFFEVVGTVKESNKPKPNFVTKVVQFASKEELYESVSKCDFIVYDITEDSGQIEEAVWIISQLHADLDKLSKDNQRTFILLSSVLTWVRSKPLDAEDPEIPFTEDDYRRRKPHPNFKEHINAEKLVIKLGKTNKSKLSTYVIASGLTYGSGENIFHYLFKAAWHNEQPLTCYGKGRNILPTIHIRDLAAFATITRRDEAYVIDVTVIQNVVDSRPKVHYMIAVDDSKNTLKQIAKAVSKSLSNGKCKSIPETEALLLKDVKQQDFDMLLVNLRMDAVSVKGSMRIKWTSETGIVENIDSIVKEFKATRELQPIRIFVSGPPASGKTTVVEQLCQQFKLHHIKVKDIIDEAIQKRQTYIDEKLKAQAAAEAGTENDAGADGDKVEEEVEEPEEEEGDLSGEYKELLESLKESREQNNGRIEDSLVIKLFREKLFSKPCQNQGFILDGFPKTTEQAKELFAVGEEADQEPDGAETPYDKLLMPSLVICLDASDDFLRNRIIELPECVIVGTHNAEEGLQRRLVEYRAINTDDETVLNYFDELEIHPEHFDITKDASVRMKDTVDAIAKLIGKPQNYGPAPEDVAEVERLEALEKIRLETSEREKKERQEVEEAITRKQKHEEWSRRLEAVRREEQELLEAQSVPLRNYLMQHVMPTLTKALRDCVAIRPDDPIDYLAEYLFRHNPEFN